MLVWQKATQLRIVLYDLTRTYPREELYRQSSKCDASGF
jgi:hypothetical protein